MTRKLKDIKALIIGMGLAGSRHLEAQLKLGIKTGVYNIRPQSIAHLRKNPQVIIFGNLKEAFDWSNLVHVCTPDDKHTEYVAEALKKRKAVLCEKPLTTDLQEALDLQALAHKHNSILVIGHNYRLTPTFIETKKRVDKGDVGTVTSIHATYLDDMTNYRSGTPWRNMQDFLYVAGSHAVDLALWIVNQPVISVQAAVGNKIRSDYDSQERYQIILKFASGILGLVSLDSSSAQIVDGSDLVVYGQDGLLKSHNKIDELIFYKRGGKKPQTIKLPNNKTLTTAQEIKIIDDYLTGKFPSPWPLPGVDEAINIIKILDAISKAVSSGKSELVSN